MGRKQGRFNPVCVLLYCYSDFHSTSFSWNGLWSWNDPIRLMERNNKDNRAAILLWKSYFATKMSTKLRSGYCWTKTKSTIMSKLGLVEVETMSTSNRPRCTSRQLTCMHKLHIKFKSQVGLFEVILWGIQKWNTQRNWNSKFLSYQVFKYNFEVLLYGRSKKVPCIESRENFA